MISKGELSGWKKEANRDLKGVSYRQIASEIGESEQVAKNYMTLTNQKRFNPDIIKKINEYRVRRKVDVQSIIAV